MSRRRDRHGRGPRGPLAWPALPMTGTRRSRFEEMVLDAAEAIERRVGSSLGIELAVEDVPPADPAPWEEGVVLARTFPAERDLPARVVLYRRPITTRSRDEPDLATLVHEVLADQVGRMLGRDPEELL